MEYNMTIYEIGTGYTPIPAKISAATETVAEELAKAFRARGVAVEVVDIAAGDRGETPLPIREVRLPRFFSRPHVCTGVYHKVKRTAYSIALAGELRRLLEQSPEQTVLHFHNQYNLYFFLKLTPDRLRRRCVVAYTNHSGIWRLSWEKIERTIHRRYFQEMHCMGRADRVFVLNEETKRNVTDHLGVAEEHLTLIPNGVNPAVFRPLSTEEKRKAAETWGLTGCTVILQSGSICENKGQLRALRLLAPLMKENGSLTFVYAGGLVSEEYQQKITAFARSEGLEDRVRYLGMVAPGEEMNELYNLAAATVCASNYEGCSLAVLESLASGTPVLTPKGFALGEGCIPYREDNFREALSRALSGEAGTPAARGYTWDAVAERYLQAFGGE